MADETVIEDDTSTETTTAETTTAETTTADVTATDTTQTTFELPDDFDWRTHWAGGDEKLLKLAGRYQSPKAALESLQQFRQKLSAGKAVEPLSDDATDEEKAAYRKVMGVPDAPEDYMKSLPDGLVVGDLDKPHLEKIMAKAHAVNAPASVTNAFVEGYYEMIEERQAAIADQARAAEGAAVEELRSKWGGDYKRNLNVMHSYLDTLPTEVAEAFKTGVGGDGVPLGYNPAVLRWLTAQALEANPLATVVPGAGANQASAVADELAAIRKTMGTPAYAKDEKAQARYRELLDAQSKLPK